MCQEQHAQHTFVWNAGMLTLCEASPKLTRSIEKSIHPLSSLHFLSFSFCSFTLMRTHNEQVTNSVRLIFRIAATEVHERLTLVPDELGDLGCAQKRSTHTDA